MKLIEIIPGARACSARKRPGIVSESECQKCEHFYGWNLGENKNRLRYGEVDWYESLRWRQPIHKPTIGTSPSKLSPTGTIA
jgi:hypothetical protein